MDRFRFVHSFGDPDIGFDGIGAALAADFDGDGRLDLVGKVWRANKAKGNSGRNHVDFLQNRG